MFPLVDLDNLLSRRLDLDNLLNSVPALFFLWFYHSLAFTCQIYSSTGIKFPLSFPFAKLIKPSSLSSLVRQSLYSCVHPGSPSLYLFHLSSFFLNMGEKNGTQHFTEVSPSMMILILLFLYLKNIS